MKVEWDLRARRELDEITRWYTERSPQAAENFLFDVQALVDRAANFPKQFQGHSDRARRAVMTHFPVCVVFLEMEDGVRIVAIAHAKRRPDYWIYRLAR
jgi:toxin ParE1/3/4